MTTEYQRTERGDLELYGASGEFISTETVGTYMLDLPSDKILELKDCYYISKIIRNITLYLCY